MTRTWVGAFGAMSRKARTCESSKTLLHGISPRRMRAKMLLRSYAMRVLRNGKGRFTTETRRAQRGEPSSRIEDPSRSPCPPCLRGERSFSHCLDHHFGRDVFSAMPEMP